MAKKKDLYQESKYWFTPAILVATFFYMIGTTLGDGIMVIPVEISTCGFVSYCIFMAVPYFFEVSAVLLFIQIIQKVRKVLTNESIEEIGKRKRTDLIIKSRKDDEESKPFLESKRIEKDSEFEMKEKDMIADFKEIDEDEHHKPDDDKIIIDQKRKDPEEDKDKDKDQDQETFISTTFLFKGLDLHSISQNYFPRWYSIILDFILLLTTLPISYSIGLSQAILSIFLNSEEGIISYTYILAPSLVIIFFIFVVIFSRCIVEILSGISVGKSSLILVVVLISLVLVNPFTSNEHFFFFSRGYFSVTTMLTGSVLVLPHLFSKLRPSWCNITLFFIAICLALFCCEIISFLWCVAVWGIVDQENGDINLKKSLSEGDLSNVPFTLTVREEYTSMKFIGSLVALFTTLSFTVSLILWTSILKSTIDGYVKDVATFFSDRYWKKQEKRKNEKKKMSEIMEIDKTDGFENKIVENVTKRETERVKKKVERVMLGFQFLLYIIFVIISVLLVLFFADKSYFLAEIMGCLYIFSYLLLIGGGVMVDTFQRKFEGETIWCKLPGWFYSCFGLLVITYYVAFCVWLVLYQTIKFFFFVFEAEMPF